jgi:hypothetical protein
MKLHPLLKNLCMLLLITKLGIRENALSVLQYYKCLPTPTSCTPPKHCERRMTPLICPKRKFGFQWRCAKKSHKKGKKGCDKTREPTKGTFFAHTKILVEEVLLVAAMLLNRTPVTTVVQEITSTRKHFNWKHPNISHSTAGHFYGYLREGKTSIRKNAYSLIVTRSYAAVGTTVVRASPVQYGGPGKTVEVDETFLTQRKYHKGRFTSSMEITILGIYCREDKIGRFWRVPTRRRQDIWPLMKKFIQ